MDDDELKEVLDEAGLSPYQADAYVTLLDLGDASAQDLADASEVPDPRIYDVLRDLEKKGYVELYERDALAARAHDPSTVLEDLRSWSDAYLDAADEIEQRWSRPSAVEHEVNFVERFDTVLARARELIDDARDQIQIAARPEQFRALRPELAAAHERGVVVKLSITTDEPTDEAVDRAELRGVCTEARHRTIPSAFMLIVDRNWTCFAPHERSAHEYGILVDDVSHAYIFHWCFLTAHWEMWETIHTERDDGAPAEYVSLHQCVRDVQEVVADDEAVRATVEGTDTETHERVTLSGEIVDVYFQGESYGTDRGIPLAQLTGETNITLEDGDGRRHSIGGWGSVLEDVEARRIRIESVEPPDRE